MNKTNTQIAIAAAAVALAATAYFVFRGPRMKSIYDWEDDINAAQGHPFTVRVPRGTYGVSSPDLVIVSELDVGTETHVTMMPPLSQPEAYTIKAVLVEEGGQAFPITITARPAPVYGEIPTRNMAGSPSYEAHASAQLGGQA